MITVYADNRQIQVSVPTLGMSPEDVLSFLNWLRVDASGRHEELTGEVSSDLCEHLKSVWWAENQDRLIAAHGRPVKRI